MFTKEAIQELAQAQAIAAADATVERADIAGLVALPSDFELHNLEQHQTYRRRARGTMTTSSIRDFAAYVADHKDDGAAVFIDPKMMRAVAVLNLGTPVGPGHADNRAVLALEPTAPYKALCAMANGQGQKQTSVAEFMEDWSPHLKCTVGGAKVGLAQAVAAVRRITIEALRKLETTEQSLSASKSTFESVKASSGADPLPTHIQFSAVPYLGMSSRDFVMRLGITTTGDKPAIVLRVINAEQHVEDMAAELVELTRSALGGSVKALVGAYVVAE